MALVFFVSVRIQDGKGDAFSPRVHATPFSRTLLDCPDGFASQDAAEKFLKEVEAVHVPALTASWELPIDAGIEVWSVVDGRDGVVWTPFNRRAKEWADVDRG
jgi:hypothetical protein